jgi:MFS family permease
MSAPPGAPTGASVGSTFWKLFVASATSNLGDGIRALAFAWLASSLTRDPLLIAGVVAATQLPWLLFTLAAGVVIDRVNRRLLMAAATVTHVAVGLLMAFLHLSGQLSIGLLFPLAVLTGCAEVVVDTTAQTLLGAIVSRAQLVRASGLLLGAEISMQSLGRPVGGFLTSLSMAAAFLVIAGLLACSTVSLLLMPARNFVPQPSKERRASWTGEIAVGFRWLWRHTLLRNIGIIIALSNVLYGAVTATLVLFAREVLELGALGFGILGSCYAVGGVLSSLLVGSLQRRLGDRGTLLLVMFGASAAFAVVGLASSVVVTALMLALVGGLITIFDAVWGVMRIRLVPDELLGRVTSILRWLEIGPFPLASMIGGVLVGLGTFLHGRSLGLHLPYFLAAAAFTLLGFVLYRVVTPEKIAAAEATQERAAAVPEA